MKLASKLLETLRKLNEKLIILNKGAKSGQIVFLAAGAGSGKGFAASNFMDLSSYKNFNVDDLKTRLVKLAKLKGSNPELANVDFKNPDDVAFLHKFVKDHKLDTKQRSTFLKAAAEAKELPNILFDVTFDDIKKFNSIKDELFDTGYKPENIHLVWVLNDFAVAAKQNKSRERVVPEDILLHTHIGAAKTVTDLVVKKKPVSGLDGEIHVILNKPSETVAFKDSKGDDVKLIVPRKTSDQKGLKKIKGGSSEITGTKAEDIFRVKSFSSLKMKDAGKSISTQDVSSKLLGWVVDSVPKQAKELISKK